MMASTWLASTDLTRLAPTTALMTLAHQQTLQSTTKAGEAFFLFDWNWWCQWCRHVDFFYTSEEAIAMATASTTIESQKESERIQQVLELLPRGAVLPTRNQKNYEDDDSSTDSETDTRTQRPPQGPPGAIDSDSINGG
jgi:hypothetical protein